MQPQYITLPKQAKDLTGQQFGRLTALGPVGKSPKGSILWLCRCDCGACVSVTSDSIVSGHTQSCGCLHRERTIKANATHGLSGHRLHMTWTLMVQRCTNPNNPEYVNYGGRGIKVCDEWRHNFQAFYDHVSNLPNYGEEGYSLDRIDNGKGYSPGNVRWATGSEQMRNSRRTHLIEFRGKTQCVTAWAEELGIDPNTLSSRLLYLSWTVERALTTPVDGRFGARK